MPYRGESIPALIFLFWLVCFRLLPLHGSEPGNKNNDTILISGVGDIMLGTSFPKPEYLPPGDDPAPLLSSVVPLLRGSNVLFCNLEGPFSDSGKLAKKCRDTTTCYAFRVPENYSFTLKEAGFNLVSLANNHIGDFGLEARDRTAGLLDSLGIHFAGPEDYPWSVFEIDSVIYGFCAFAPNKGVMDVTDIPAAKKIITFLDDTCDIVIVSMHAGAEGADYQHVPRAEEDFYGENRGDVYKFAHAMIDAGADIVFGHGPHVTRAVEIYSDRFIAYSLGNFCTYRRFNLTGPNGYSPLIKVRVDREGRFLGGTIDAVYQDQYGHTRPDPYGRAIRKIRELVESDFPGSGTIIDENGNIYKKE